MTSDALADAIDQFTGARGYLAAASIGLPPKAAVSAMRADLNAWEAADRDPMGYDGTVAATRASYARLVNMPVGQVAIGSQTSVIAAVVAAAVPTGAEVVCVEGDFTSIVFPFMQRPDITVRCVPLEALADTLTDQTWLVAFSLAQSSNGRIADVPAVLAAAAAHDVATFCDTTQAAGVHPVDASIFDITACHAYKWLCSPRGVAFMTVGLRADPLLRPVQAGWYSGDSVWTSIYGPAMNLAPDARRFDVSPAWQAWIGAEQSIDLFAGLDIHEVWERTSALGDALCDGLGIPPQHQAIVTWPDETGDDVKKLVESGIRVSGRAGRLRAAFHLWNDDSDVDAVLRVLRSS
ncbi:aminotransferase class V-fold PLP-dependent enzyme [soil metagenome]